MGYDLASFNTLRDDLIARAPPAETIIWKGFIEDIADIEAPHYQMTNTAGWAGLPAKEAFYFVVLPGDEAANSGDCASVNFQPPELQTDRNGYWSLTLYDESGCVVTDPFKISLQQATANDDGSYTLRFNCGGEAEHNLQAPENWNGLFRAYLPTSLDSILAFEKDFTENRKIVAE